MYLFQRLSFEEVSILHQTTSIIFNLVTLPPNMPLPDNLPRSSMVLYCLVQKTKMLFKFFSLLKNIVSGKLVNVYLPELKMLNHHFLCHFNYMLYVCLKSHNNPLHEQFKISIIFQSHYIEKLSLKQSLCEISQYFSCPGQ